MSPPEWNSPSTGWRNLSTITPFCEVRIIYSGLHTYVCYKLPDDKKQIKSCTNRNKYSSIILHRIQETPVCHMTTTIGLPDYGWGSDRTPSWKYSAIWIIAPLSDYPGRYCKKMTLTNSWHSKSTLDDLLIFFPSGFLTSGRLYCFDLPRWTSEWCSYLEKSRRTRWFSTALSEARRMKEV